MWYLSDVVRARTALGVALLATSLVATGLALACTTPTLPLPPPLALASVPDSDGIVTVSGSSLEGAWVTCVNLDTELGHVVRADDMGFFTIRIEAQPGHYLNVWQRVGPDMSPGVDLVVPPPR